MSDSTPIGATSTTAAFTTDELAWHAWITPVDPETGTPEQRAVIEASVWPNSPYFRLLAWHPAALHARTLVDEAVFLGRPGLRRGERELAATVVSRVNGCVLCTSVHARLTITFTKKADEVARILDEGVDTELDERWRAITDAAAALTAIPNAFGPDNVAALQAAGLKPAEILDVVQSGAFFAWANRLMLSLGEPLAPSDDDIAAIGDQQSNEVRSLATENAGA